MSTIAEQIKAACDRLDRDAARQLAEKLAADIRKRGKVYREDLALAALKPLRGKRYFDILLDLADAIFESGQNVAKARTWYAQGLIDTGRLWAAIPYIEALLARKLERGDRNEALGLLGRAYKQLYVNSRRREYAELAFAAYNSVFASDANESWHGINAVALQHREKDLPLARGAAQRILDGMRKQIRTIESAGWAYATAAEAALALGDDAEARRLYEAYAAYPWNDAFEIASSLRQLEQVWELDEKTAPGKEILPLLRGALLKREGGAVALAPKKVAQEIASTEATGLEKTFGAYGTQTLTWYRTGLERCNGVCRIERRDDKAWGTGFLVRGGDFHPTLGDEVLVLTNHHVVNDSGSPALRAGEAKARFQALSLDKTYPFDEKIVWSSKDLDATLLRFASTKPGSEPFPLATQQPTRTKDQPPPIPRVYITGHPQGGMLSFSLVNNELKACDKTRLHYLAPTEPGSSGSPVFDEQWAVVGLHHRGHDKLENLLDGGEPYAANEAYWIGAVQASCRRSKVAARPRATRAKPAARKRRS